MGKKETEACQTQTRQAQAAQHDAHSTALPHVTSITTDSTIP